MKKTLTLLLAAVATLSMTAANLFTPSEAQMGTPVKMENVKQAPAGMQAKMMARLASKLKATPNFPASTAADLVGGYAWTYRQYTGGMTTQPDTISNNYTFQRDTVDNVNLVGINKISDTQIRLTGFMPLPITATMGTTSGYTTFTVDENQVVYTHSTYGDCTIAAAWYYEGDDTYEAGWYVGDVMGILVDEGIVMDTGVHFYMKIMSGTYANYRLGWIYEPGSTMVPVSDFNAMMSFTYNNTIYDWPVIATENNETYVVSVDNFAGIGTTPVNFTLAEDKTWTADQAVFYTSGDNNFAFANTTDYGVVAGTGTEKVLTFGQNWTGYDANTSYWLGERSATTITLISDEEFVYPAEETGINELYIVGEFNGWNQNADGGRVELIENEGVFEGDVELEANSQFKVISFDAEGNPIWFGGESMNQDYFLVTPELYNNNITLINGNGGYNFKMQEAGTYHVKVMAAPTPAKGVNEPLVMVVTKTPTAISTVGTDVKADNAYYNLMGVKFNGMPSVPGIYIHNGKKVIVK